MKKTHLPDIGSSRNAQDFNMNTKIPVENKTWNHGKKEDYYEGNLQRKLTDFCLGFFGVIISGFIFGFLGLYFINFLSNSSNNISGILRPLGIIIDIVIFGSYIGLTIISFNKGRRYIGIGIISTIIIPFLIAGACFVIFIAISAGGGF